MACVLASSSASEKSVRYPSSSADSIHVLVVQLLELVMQLLASHSTAKSSCALLLCPWFVGCCAMVMIFTSCISGKNQVVACYGDGR